jgi:hypothetical protein
MITVRSYHWGRWGSNRPVPKPKPKPQPFAMFERISEQISAINKAGRIEQPKDYPVEKRGIVSRVKTFFRRVFTRGR